MVKLSWPSFHDVTICKHHEILYWLVCEQKSENYCNLFKRLKGKNKKSLNLAKELQCYRYVVLPG